MIILDTHVLLWWADHSPRLSKQAESAIARERATTAGAILVSTISAWEIAMLIRGGRLDLTSDLDRWLTTVSAIPQVKFVPITNDIATHSVMLPGAFHKDPADRIIVATARKRATLLITNDTKIQRYPHVDTLW